MVVNPTVSRKVVSVICPVRNMSGRLQKLEKWIYELCEDPRVEVIVVHDYSEDETEDELFNICKERESVILIGGCYGNPGSARNAGLEICTGLWVSFWDCDDQPNTNEFLRLIEEIEDTKPEISFGRFSILNENSGLEIQAPTWTSLKEKNLSIVAQNPGIWRIIFLRDLLQGMAFKPLRMAEDQIFILEVIVKASKVNFFNNLIYTYFTGSASHLTKNSQALQDLLPAFNQTSRMIGVAQNETNLFIQNVATRQLLSGLKFGTFQTKVKLIKSFIRSKMLFRSFFLRTVIQIFSSSRWGN